MKKLISSLLICLLVAVFFYGTDVQAQTSQSAQNQVKAVWYNDSLVSEDQLSVVYKNEVAYLPLRNVFEALNYQVSWNKQSNHIEAFKYGNTYIIDIEGKKLYFLNQEYTFDHEPQLINGRLYASIIDIEGILNANIELNAADSSLFLTQEPSKGLFWKIEKDGAIVYLLGSVHAGSNNMYPIRDEIEKAFYTSDHLVLEVDTTAVPDEEEIEQIQKIMMYTDGTTLKDHIDADTYKRLQELLEAFDLPTDFYDNYKPFAVVSDLTGYAFSLENYVAGLGIDLYYILKANELNKNILELESRPFQLEILNGYSIEYQQNQIQSLADSILGLAEPEADSQSITDLVEIWVSGNDEGAAKLVEETKNDKEMYELMITKRHDAMIEKIEGYLNNKNKDSYFVVVGYLHLLGEDGLVTVLKEKGYEVTRE